MIWRPKPKQLKKLFLLLQCEAGGYNKIVGKLFFVAIPHVIDALALTYWDDPGRERHTYPYIVGKVILVSSLQALLGHPWVQTTFYQKVVKARPNALWNRKIVGQSGVVP